ncbi:DUF1840 domain-containing protein [Paraburkholderia sabiae]|uniref:DUF1840 domain-containing protein n=1 Tax=Paraburkholderia sabiae TaxID=273251 RepID=A0ABU9Q9M9_9BURK|nr:DUF1840 domain-containing protein [Paraburkholderia sabiae]WJZ78628.1 DUF1840 domain-containing protein [Paraburkholderia sabiae]CAD6510614.1 hypothetical protein LMG24235_00374 [Paraburkholderia sabiae]
MLVTFQSPATPDVIMLRDLAQYMLGLIGKRLDNQGVIAHDDLPEAIRRLEAAIVDDKQTAAAHEASTASNTGHHQHAGFSQRAWPFLDMLREARRQNADILWGL